MFLNFPFGNSAPKPGYGATPRRNRVRRIFVIIPGLLFFRGFRNCLHHPMLTLSAVLISWILFAAGLSHLKILISIPDMLSKSSVEYKNIETIEESFPVANPLILMFESTAAQTLTNHQLCQIKTVLHQIDYTRTDVKSITSIFRLQYIEYLPQKLKLRYQSYLANICEEAPNDISFAKKMANGVYKGMLINKDATSVIAEIQLASQKEAGTYGRFNPKSVDDIVNLANTILGNQSQLRVYSHGAAGFKSYFFKSLNLDVLSSIGIAVALILLMRWCYGTWLSGFLLMGTLWITTNILLAMMSFFGTPLDMLTSSLFVVVSLAAAEDFIYISTFKRHPGTHWRAAFRKAMVPSFYTSLTTFVGFISLTTSSILPIQRLGLWAGCGAMIEWVITMFALPALLSLVPKWQNWTRPPSGRFNGAISRISVLAPPRFLTPILLAGLVVAVGGFMSVHANDSVEEMWPKSHPFSIAMQKTKDQFGWKGGVDVIFRPEVKEEEVGLLVSQIEEKSAATQIDSGDRLRNDMIRPSLPKSIQALVNSEIATSREFSRYNATTGGFHRAVFYLPSVEMVDVTKFRDTVRSACNKGQCVVSGDLIALSSFSEAVIETLNESFATSLVTVSIIIAFLAYANGTGHSVRLILSSMWGPVVLMGSTPLLLNGINFVTCIFASVLVGLAGDSAIQFIFAGRRRGIQDGISNCQEGSIAVCLILSISSLIYLGSPFLQPRNLGLLFCCGYLVLLVGDLWFLKSLMAWTARLKNFTFRLKEVKHGTT